MPVKSSQTVWIVLFFAVGCVVVYFYHDSLIGILSMMAMSGAFGGLLYTARDSGLELIHRNPKPENQNVINLGWLADCAYGIAGAFVVFLILPTELNAGLIKEPLFAKANTLVLIKFLSLALVGGYGGRSLVDKALANIAKDAKEARKQVQKTEADLQQVKIDLQKASEKDSAAMERFYSYMDDEEDELDIEDFKNTIANASKIARTEIFKDTRATRRKGLKNEDSNMIERTIPLFEALIAADEEKQFHRNHGQLGFALWDIDRLNNQEKNLDRIHSELTTAIELRDKSNVKGFKKYEFVRAMCAIKMGAAMEVINADLNRAAEQPSVLIEIKNAELISEWAKASKFDLETL